MNMLEKIQFQLEHLSKSERKVAEVILASPAQAIHSSIAALAQEAGVSEPTVNRFCRSLETRGFPDFKLHLAQILVCHGARCSRRNAPDIRPYYSVGDASFHGDLYDCWLRRRPRR